MPLPQITWDDVQEVPDDGNRYEVIEGALYMTPAPSVRHQRIVFRLQRELARLLVDPGHGEILFAPVGVRFPATQEGVQPDILFVSNERRGIVAPDELKERPISSSRSCPRVPPPATATSSAACTSARAWPGTGSSTPARTPRRDRF